MYAIASSGGKDSTLASYIAQQGGFAVTHLFHIYNADTSRVRFHGYRPALVEEQAELMGLKSIIMATKSQEFDNDFKTALETVKQEGLRGIIFGNIFLKDSTCSRTKVPKEGISGMGYILVTIRIFNLSPPIF
jgi:diphthamide synthase (EF-2-diphthine--ammonia ligase)